jgi:NitT/TauT family transport system substrate-binding protein
MFCKTMKISMKISMFVVFILAISTILVSTAEAKPIRLGVMVDMATSYIPILGDELGLYKKYDVDVNSQEFSAGINTLDALALERLDLGQAADFAALNRIGGTEKSNLRIYAKLSTSRPESQNFYVKDDTVASPKDLAGKSIALRKGTVDEYWVARLLELNGVDPKSVKLLPVSNYPDGVAIVQSGRATGMWATGKAGVTLAATEGVRKIADLSTIIAPTVTVLISTQKYLDENKEIMVRYLKAVDEILEFMANDPEKAGEIINKKTNVPVEQVVLNIKREAIKLEFNQLTIDSLDRINKWGHDAGVIKIPYDVRNYVNVDALRDAFPDRVEYK